MQPSLTTTFLPPSVSNTETTLGGRASRTRPGKNCSHEAKRWANTHPSASIAPYAQGDLDGLCGLYALINAVRFLLRSAFPLDREAVTALFGAVVAAVDRHAGFAHVARYGIDTEPLAKVIRRALRWLAKHHGVRIDLRRPWRHAPHTPLVVLLVALHRDLTAGAVVLIGFGGTLDHWTVVTAITPQHMRLFDSMHRARVRLDCCRMSHEPGKPGTDHIIDADGVFLLRHRSGRHRAEETDRAWA